MTFYCKDQEEHNRRLYQVLKQLESANVTLNPKKCEFRKSTVTFLGHIVDREGVRADPSKTEAINRMEAPSTVSEVPWPS